MLFLELPCGENLDQLRPLIEEMTISSISTCRGIGFLPSWWCLAASPQPITLTSLEPAGARVIISSNEDGVLSTLERDVANLKT